MKEFLKKKIKGYEKASFGSAKDKCAVPKFIPSGHTSHTAMYGKHRPASMFSEQEGKQRAPLLLSASREPFTVTNVPFR